MVTIVRPKSKVGLAVALLVLVMGLHLATPTQGHSNTFPYVSPEAELSAAWWQWAVIEPWATNPIADATGVNASKNRLARYGSWPEHGLDR